MKKLCSLLAVVAVAIAVASGVGAPQPAFAAMSQAPIDLTATSLTAGSLAEEATPAEEASQLITAATDDPIIGVWVGTYTGYDNDDPVKRTVKMEVDKHSGNTFSGRITITSESACWYLFEGTLDEKTGACTFEGTEWLQNSRGFDFTHFEGKLAGGSTSTIKGTCDDAGATFSLKRTSKETTAYGGAVKKLNRVWKGEYDGYSGGTVVRRDFIMNITSYSLITGEVKGTAYIKPSKKASAYYGVNGSYKFSGTLDRKTGLLTMQGHTWIQYPVGEDAVDFDFVYLRGYLDSTGTKISGMSQDGIWQMSTEKTSKLFGNAKTSQGFRYPKSYKKSMAAYPALANLTSVATYGMPGVVKSSSMVGSSKQMVPQGICVAKDFILITAYCANEDYCSAIYVLSKKTGKLLKTLETSDANHVGGIAFDGKRVYVARSTQNQVGVIDYSTIAAAVKEKGNVVPVYYAKTIDVWGVASFVTYYDKRLWVGYCAPSKSDPNSSNLRGFTIYGSSVEDLDLVEDRSFYGLPNCANGAAFAKIDGQDRLVVNTSPGRKYDSTRYVYKADIARGETKLLFKQTLPPMIEESCVSGKKTYTIFESSATKYSTYASGAPCKYIVDRVCVGNTSQLFSATTGTYVTLGVGNKAASYRILNSKKLAYAAPSPFNKSKTLYIPSVGEVGKVKRAVTGIDPKAFAYASKAKTLKIATTKLTAKAVKNSLKGSKLKTLKVPSERLKTYKEAFSKANCGKKVKLKKS